MARLGFVEVPLFLLVYHVGKKSVPSCSRPPSFKEVVFVELRQSFVNIV